jgi:chloramphenicol 3-O-phosphotransferase
MMRLTDLLKEGVYDPGILKCIFLAGGPGSGKSSVAQEIFGIQGITTFSFSGLKSVNSDTAFEAQLKKHGIDGKELARIEKEDPALWKWITEDPNGVRELSKKTTAKIKAFYEAGRLGMIIDGTGDDVAKIQRQKRAAEALGYDTFMVFVNTSLEVAKFRNSMRQTRRLPDTLLVPSWKECQNNLGKFQTIFSGGFRIVDNTNNGNNVTGDMKKAVDSFVNSGIRNPIGKKWVTTQLMLKNANIIK